MQVHSEKRGGAVGLYFPEKFPYASAITVTLSLEALIVNVPLPVIFLPVTEP